jgi:hypothetical protein
MSPPEPLEDLSPAEQRLAQHLSLLRHGPPAPSSLAGRVIRTARWQHAVSSPLRVAVSFAAAAGDAIRLLLGVPKQ